jgi:SAM-dependent methyltransferase
MSSRHGLFRVFYRFGFTPWDGHPLARSLRDLIEGNGGRPLTPGRALDLGCGTGNNSIYLAQQGWQVSGIDFVPKALDQARAKAAVAGVEVKFLHADVTRLSSQGVGTGFPMIVDNGCLHGMSHPDRDAYAREVTAVAAPEALLLIVGFIPGASFGVPGIRQSEVERRFAGTWTMLSAGDERELDHNGRNPARHYLLQRRR